MFAACNQASAESDSFRVSIVVLPERAATTVPMDLPAPPQAEILPASRDAKRLLYQGTPGEARRFYEGTLPRLGFHLAQQDANGAVWVRADVRAELRFHPVAGRETTGIHVMISPQPD